MHLKSCTIILSSLLALVSPGVGSQPVENSASTKSTDKDSSREQSQRELPISIEADSAEQNEQQGLTIYRGNVTMTQGRLRIEADEIQIVSVKIESENNRQISEVVANGDLAVFSHRDKADSEVIAMARTIDYSPRENTVVLTGSASLEQQGSSVRGEKIEYFISEQKVKAAASPGEKQGRVKTVITPGQGISFGSREKKNSDNPSSVQNLEESQ